MVTEIHDFQEMTRVYRGEVEGCDEVEDSARGTAVYKQGAIDDTAGRYSKKKV